MGRMRLRPALVALGCLLLVACSGSQTRDLARYYDPQGLFSAELPAANGLSVTDPQRGQGSSAILSGVVSSPPQPSASPSSQFGGALGGIPAQAGPAGDQTQYQVLAVTTDSFPNLEAMTLYFLTADPSIDVRDERHITMGRAAGRLIVADVLDSGASRAGLAAAFTLGADGVGYIVAAVFPPGDWSREEADFARIMGSLDTGVPSGLASFPLATG
jgi:hypothetical protein